MSDQDFALIGEWPKCEFSVVGIVFQDKLNRVGLQLRDDFEYVSGGGLWSIFGGHTEDNETPVETAIRELEEETGIRLTEADLEPFVRLVPEGGLQAYHYYFRVKRPVEPHELNVQEGAGFAFMHHGQFMKYDFMVSARIVLSYLHTIGEFEVS